MFFSSFYVRKGRRSYVFLFSLQRNSSLARFFCKQEKKKGKKNEMAFIVTFNPAFCGAAEERNVSNTASSDLYFHQV